jgi:hypothetical protein
MSVVTRLEAIREVIAIMCDVIEKFHPSNSDQRMELIAIREEIAQALSGHEHLERSKINRVELGFYALLERDAVLKCIHSAAINLKLINSCESAIENFKNEGRTRTLTQEEQQRLQTVTAMLKTLTAQLQIELDRLKR